jgi:hypothetical protein
MKDLHVVHNFVVSVLSGSQKFQLVTYIYHLKYMNAGMNTVH